MKWYTISWLLPSNRSASVCLPLGPSNTYFLSIFSQGSSRRCLLISSRSLVSSFSFFNNSTLADRHFSALTTSCCIAVFVISSSPTVNLVGHGIAVPVSGRIAAPTINSQIRRLAGRRLRLAGLGRRVQLRKKVARFCVHAWITLFSPGFEPCAALFEIVHHVLVAEHLAPAGDGRLQLLPYNPHFPAVFEEQLFVDQSAVRDAGHHLPVADHHPHVGVLQSARGTQLHRFLHALWMEVRGVPVPSFSQLRFPPGVVQLQHQVDLFDRGTAHASSFGFTSDFCLQPSSSFATSTPLPSTHLPTVLPPPSLQHSPGMPDTFATV